jgi:hypothetical protein
MSREENPVLLVQTLTRLEVDYWHEVDFNWGRDAHSFYVEDGVFAIGDHRMNSRDEVAKFYAWRHGRGERTARHVVTNFRLEQHSDTRATLRCILLLYAADGKPVLPSLPAILIADVVSEFVRDRDGEFRYRSHLLTPVFMGGERPTVPTGGN